MEQMCDKAAANHNLNQQVEEASESNSEPSLGARRLPSQDKDLREAHFGSERLVLRPAPPLPPPPKSAGPAGTHPAVLTGLASVPSSGIPGTGNTRSPGVNSTAQSCVLNCGAQIGGCVSPSPTQDLSPLQSSWR